MMEIFVGTLTGKLVVLQVEPSDTIAMVKAKFYAKEGADPEWQNLVFAGRTMEDSKTLKDYNIQAGVKIHNVMRFRGMISTFTSTDTTDPTTQWLMLTDEERATAAEPLKELEALAQKNNVANGFTQSQFDISDEYSDTMDKFIRWCWKERIDCSGRDMKVVMTPSQMIMLLGKLAPCNYFRHVAAEAFVAKLMKLYQGSESAKLVFRATKGPTDACIAFHCDGQYATSTTQIALSEDCKGGSLVYYRDNKLHVVKRERGSLTHHRPRILHGVTRLVKGMRKSLFVLDKSNGLGDKDVIIMSDSFVRDFSVGLAALRFVSRRAVEAFLNDEDDDEEDEDEEDEDEDEDDEDEKSTNDADDNKSTSSTSTSEPGTLTSTSATSATFATSAPSATSATSATSDATSDAAPKGPVLTDVTNDEPAKKRACRNDSV